MPRRTDDHQSTVATASHADLLESARARFKLAEEAETEMRLEALDDLKFRAGEQWPEDVKRSRAEDKRPMLTINRIPQYVRSVTNDFRQSRPSIKVSPVDDKGDPVTAKILQGMIRHIENNSDAAAAYDTAFDGAAGKGFGYFRIVTDYTDPMSFNQEIQIKRVRDSFSVYLDPSSQKLDGSDANWGFIFEDMTPEDFKRTYPEAELSSMQDWRSLGDIAPGWISEAGCRVAEYFTKTFKEVMIYLLNTGEIVEGDEPTELPDGISVVNKRRTTKPAIKWYKLTGIEVLDETDWPGQWIPIIPAYGEEIYVEGKRKLEGVIRHAKDPQKMYNFWASSETEAIALAPRAPFVGAAGQFEGREAQWRTANQKNHAYLEYNPKMVNGQLAPPPQRQAFEPAVMAITQARMQSAEDLKATTGIYDASLGMRSNEQSGIAIERRNRQSQTNNFHLFANMGLSIKHGGRVILDLIPRIYDAPTVTRIINDDGQEEIVKIQEMFDYNGEQKKFDFSIGKYDVTLDQGPSFQTRRQEAVASMMDLTKVNPQIAAVASDLMVKNMDWPGASEIAERIRKTMDPKLFDQKNGAEIPPQVQAQIAEMGKMVEMLTTQLNAANDKINTKSVELESKERIEMAKIQAQIEIKLAELGSREALELLAHEVSEIQGRLGQLGYNVPFENGSEEVPGEYISAEPTEINQPTGGLTPG